MIDISRASSLVKTLFLKNRDQIMYFLRSVKHFSNLLIAKKSVFTFWMLGTGGVMLLKKSKTEDMVEIASVLD